MSAEVAILRRTKRKELSISKVKTIPAKKKYSDESKHTITRALDNPLYSMRELTKGSLFFFLKYFWSEYSQDVFKPNWHIEYICHELEIAARRVAAGEPKLHDIVINVPPGSTKTAIVSIMFPIWCWVNWFHLRFITASYTRDLSLESSEYSRDIIRSDKFKELFPEIAVKSDKDTKSNFRIVKLIKATIGKAAREIRGGNRFATSVGGTVTGFHGHINIVDDPIDPLRTTSEQEIKKANYWMDNVLPFRKVDKDVTLMVMIMQRLHQDDPTAHLMKANAKLLAKGEPSDIKHISIPGEINNYRHTVKPKSLIKRYSKEGLLDPIRLSKKALATYEALGNYTYGGQIGQDPVPLGGGMIEVDKLVIVHEVPPPYQIKAVVRYWDKAGTEGGDGPYSVGVKMAKLVDGRFLILDVKRGRWSTNKRENIILATANADGSKVKVYVEQEPGSGGKESAEATVRNLSGFSIYKDRPQGDKTLRADPFSVQVNESNVLMLYGAWNTLYVDELKHFPNSLYKDQTDASSGAFAKLTNKKKVRIGGSRR